MNIRWVVLFATVAEEGSFTRAAGQLNIAQPWLSAQIRKLEYELGVQLFERMNAGVELTREGRELLPYARQVAEGTRNFRELARTMGDDRTKTVRIGNVTPMVDVRALEMLNSDFVMRYMNYSIKGEAGTTEEVVSGLRAGHFDLVTCLAPFPEAADIDEQDLEWLILEPLNVFLLGRRDLVGQATDLPRGRILLAPAADRPPAVDVLVRRFDEAGAVLRTAPEADKRALEHHVRHHEAVAIMMSGSPLDYENDPYLGTASLDGGDSVHRLMRVRGRDLGRAAERYWLLAKTVTSELGQRRLDASDLVNAS